jgi:hypothetical protein
MSIFADWRLHARCALSSLAIAGCFEVRQVGVEPALPALEIDDFEDGNDAPSSSLFASWHCETSPGPPRASCGPVAPGFASGVAEVVRFEIVDPPNGSIDYAGMLLEAPSRLGPLDLSAYQSIAFSAKLERMPRAGDSAGPDDDGAEAVDLLVRTACDGVGQSRGLPYGSWLEAPSPVGPEWSSLSVDVAQLIRPNYVLDLNRLDCLANVESLIFYIGPELSDGEGMAGTLTIDDVVLE